MLIQTLIPGATEGTISGASDVASKEFSCDQTTGAENWKDPDIDQLPWGECTNFVSGREISDASSSLNHSSISLQTSTSAMSRSSAFQYVYKRRKHKQNSFVTQASVQKKIGRGCNSSIISDVNSGATKELLVSVEAETEGAGSPLELPVSCPADGFVSKFVYSSECVQHEEPCSEEATKNDPRTLHGCGIDDTCSSSKLNLDVVSVSSKTDVEDTAQCSSSAVLLSEGSWESMSVKDICVAILRSQGLLEKVSLIEHVSSAGDDSANCCSRKCKRCGCSDTTLNMLICDSCEDAFHASCCNPRVKRIPTDEWLCYSCLKKKHKMLKEKSTSMNVDNESDECRSAASKGELGLIESMLKNIEPTKFAVRIGDEFQAEVPDWPYPKIDEIDPVGEPEEMSESEYLDLHVQTSEKSSQLPSIGNWLQCQDVIEGIAEQVNGTICGKWRRAPLFEVQTDDWECFRAVLWDPAHGDCAVPQELPTEEVLKQLKYKEMLRPRLAAKKRKLDQTNASCSEVKIQE